MKINRNAISRSCGIYPEDRRPHVLFESSVFNQLEGYSSSYVGTKFAIEGISASLRRELLVYGIDVIVIAPHSTNTPFLDKVEAQNISMHDNTPYQRPGELVLDFIVRDGRKG